MTYIEKIASVYLPSIDAKDLYIANHTVIENKIGYSLKKADGSVNYRKYTNTIPPSLNIFELRNNYASVYGREEMSWFYKEKEYTNAVINVTFKYSHKQFNRMRDGLYVRDGYMAHHITLTDCVCVQNGELIAIQTDVPFIEPVTDDVLGKLFFVKNGMYASKEVIPPIYSVASLRKTLYDEGFFCDGVHYIRYKRSAGSSRVGKCLFIDEKLYSLMHEYDLCGLKIEEGDDLDTASFESYISLTDSSIIDTIEIDPRSILLIDDYESVFKDDAVVTWEEHGEIRTSRKMVDVKNSIWDGQSLLQSESFGKYQKYGFMLLRNRFFKSACFNCNIQKFFADNGITSISQLNGKTFATDISDIKMITTPSSIKYLKFGSFEKWIDMTRSTFGVVKHEKPTHYFGGRLVQTHYQLINTLQMTVGEVRELLQPSLDYACLLKAEPSVLRYSIKYPEDYEFISRSLPSKNDIVYSLMGVNEAFTKTKMYADFRNDLIKSHLKDLRKGKILINGMYATMCGNPVEMLLSAIGKFDGHSVLGVGNVHNLRFAEGATLLGSRSPHVTMGNIWLTNNVRCAEIERYFVSTNEIVYVNSINENLLERLSGCDCHKGRLRYVA